MQAGKAACLLHPTLPPLHSVVPSSARASVLSCGWATATGIPFKRSKPAQFNDFQYPKLPAVRQIVTQSTCHNRPLFGANHTCNEQNKPCVINRLARIDQILG